MTRHLVIVGRKGENFSGINFFFLVSYQCHLGSQLATEPRKCGSNDTEKRE